VLATSPDAIYFQDIGAKQPEYSRSISRASATLIRERHAAYGHDTIQEVSHDGIDDAFLEKASSVHYCEAGAWRRLDGAD
jgi:hypothetical protein